MSLVVWCPMALEARAARRGIARGIGEAGVICTGIGPRRSRRVEPVSGAVMVVGVGGAVVDGIEPGDVVVATEASADDVSPIVLPAATTLAEELRDAGFTVHTGPVASVPFVATGRRRRELSTSGAVAVDMETAWLLENHRGPAAAVRVMSDSVDHEVWSPSQPVRMYRALRTIRQLMPVLQKWTKEVV